MTAVFFFVFYNDSFKFKNNNELWLESIKSRLKYSYIFLNVYFLNVFEDMSFGKENNFEGKMRFGGLMTFYGKSNFDKNLEAWRWNTFYRLNWKT